MKRIFVLCVACMVLMSGIVSAEVKKGTDSFTGGRYVGSWNKLYPFFDDISFVKKVSDGITTYKFSISLIGSKSGVLGNAIVEMKIEGFPVCELKDYRYTLNGPDSYGVKYSSSIDVKFPAELAEKIKDAKRVAIQFEDATGMRWPYVIPDDVLAEWKEVINATEWDILQAIEAKKKEAK